MLLAGLLPAAGPLLTLSFEAPPAFADEEDEAAATPTPVEPTATPTPSPTATPTPQASTEQASERKPPKKPRAPARAANAETPKATATALAYPIPGDQPDDYAVPNGHFFSQAVPGAPPGFGFTVADAAGVPLWTEFRRVGGLGDLGYPISRRFIWGDSVAQAFQAGILRWRADRGRAELETLEHLGRLPFAAIQPEPPARLGAWAAHQAWSGWWWPATSLVGGPHLFDSDGPLAKYDRFVMRGGRDDPRTLEWEQKELWLEDLSWAGHCNGWAAAALLEDEPAEPREVGGLTFSIADLKGLLTAYHFADSAAWLHGGEDYDDLTPLDFHRRLVDWLGNGKKGFILTFRPSQDEEVWSFPAYRFELVMGGDPADPDLTHVKATVWLADNNVAADYVGVRPWRGEPQTYEYALLGPREAPTGGAWEGASAAGGFAHPSYIWYPDSKHRNLDRPLSSPNLEYRTIEKILQRR